MEDTDIDIMTRELLRETDKSSPMSFVSAGVLPLKLLQSKDAVVDGAIRPIHIQLIPTNRCNSGCSWCSCRRVDRKKEMRWAELQELLQYFRELGSKSITITGGGEPTLYPHFDEFLELAGDLGYDLGLVTNGLRWGKKEGELPANHRLTWVRMSIVDTQTGEYDSSRVRRVANRLPDVDMGISFTVPKDVSLKTASEICRIAEETPNITHIRFVENIVDFSGDAMDRVESRCRTISSKAIFQRRSAYSRGQSPCHISFLKPMIDVDGSVYPCCGVQYAGGGESQDLKMPQRFRMGHWTEFHRLNKFDGSVCNKCYYENYNNILSGMTRELTHKTFL